MWMDICARFLLYNLLLSHRCSAFFYMHTKWDLDIFPEFIGMKRMTHCLHIWHFTCLLCILINFSLWKYWNMLRAHYLMKLRVGFQVNSWGSTGLFLHCWDDQYAHELCLKFNPVIEIKITWWWQQKAQIWYGSQVNIYLHVNWVPKN